MQQKTVLFWGRFNATYSRDRVYISLFKQLGWNVELFMVRYCCALGDLEYHLRGPKCKPNLIWVPVCRHRDILTACRYAHKHGIPVIFDPMISAWDKKVLEQQVWAKDGFRANCLLRKERAQFAAPDCVTCDTSCHADFFHNVLNVPREKLRVLFTGTDEKVFKPGPDPVHKPGDPLRILYHGAYLPLHGLDTIVEAARQTQDLNIHWDFLGWGAYKAETEAKAAGIKNITFLEKVPYTQVPEVIYSADVVLGVFGTTDKASRVIGNKVYEAMACGRPVINEFCTGYPPAAQTCPAITFIPPGDSAALINAVVTILEKRDQLHDLNIAARKFFDENLSMAVIIKQLESIVNTFAK